MNIFQLRFKTTLLQEIVIRQEPLSAQQIVKNAFKNLKKHLRTTPYLVGNRYREYVKVDGKYKGYTEAVCMLYMGGYNRKYNSFKNKSYTYDLAQWKHIRRSNCEYRRLGRVGSCRRSDSVCIGGRVTLGAIGEPER